MRELAGPDVYQLEECLQELAEHHNTVSVNFPGQFPKKPVQDTLASFEQDLRSGRSRIAVVENGTKTLGFCKADFCGAEGVLDYLIVLKEARGRGYGDALLDWGLNVLKESGARRIEVKVVDGNNAIRFYEKHGFRVVSHVLRMK